MWRSRCLPTSSGRPLVSGAELGERQPDGSYKGAFLVKLGPLSFRFAGKFGFLEMDGEAGTAKVSASGTDTKGRGGAQAIVNVSMLEKWPGIPRCRSCPTSPFPDPSRNTGEGRE